MTILVALCPANPAAGAAGDLKVMSFNIRTANAADGVNDWDGNRKNLVEQTIRNYGPDLVGIQEDLERQRDFLADKFTGFEVRRPRREGRQRRRVRQHHVPQEPLRRTPPRLLLAQHHARCPRQRELGRPRSREWSRGSSCATSSNPSFTFVIMNTHWDHVSAEARVDSATLMRAEDCELASGIPVIVTGDFNADQGGNAYQRMRGIDDFDTVRNLGDTYRNIHPGDSDTVGTAHGFDGHAGDGRIDWILHDNDFTTLDADIDRTIFDGFYPSDHFPINALLRPVPEPTSAAALGAAAATLLSRRRHAL